MKVRLRFAKVGKIRWTSHRDVARMWERALRRVELPLAYTEGFSPRPKLSFGLALPTGAESWAEYLDLELAVGTDCDVDALPRRLSPALPVGIDLEAAAVLPVGAGSLQQEVTSCRWEVEMIGIESRDLAPLVQQAHDAPSLVVGRERKGRETQDDIRPAVLALSSDSTLITCELATLERGVRPAELVRAVLELDGSVRPDVEIGRICRTHQWIERDGARWEPLPLAATDAHAHAEARAS